MKLAFSNIAFSAHDSPPIWALLRSHGVTGIEVAPTKIWAGWQGATPSAAREYRQRLADQGFTVPALQAVLFGKPDARLFDDAGERALADHLNGVARLAGALGAHAVVLGAPKQRDRGALTQEQAVDHAAQVLRPVAEVFAQEGTCLCIEPNPRRYACNFIINAVEGVELVERVDSRGFGLHLDAAGMFLEQESLPAFLEHASVPVRHFHISEPDLGDFQKPQVPHAENFRALRQHRYEGWCSVEMREPSLPLKDVGPWSILP